MLVNLDAIPAWTVIVAEVVALGLLGVTGLFIVKPRQGRRVPIAIPIAIGVAAALTSVQAAIQERGWRVAAWLVVVLSLTFALSALGKRGTVYAQYWKIERRYGKDSKELRSYAAKLALRIILIGVALLVISAVLIKGAYSQGT